MLGLAAAAGCVTPASTATPYSSSAPESTTRATRPPTAPSWRFKPLSWEKLETVESWLAGPGRRSSAELRVEAEMTLARGRLAFATRDRQRLDADVLDSRLDAANSGFERVLVMPGTTAVDRQRAEAGRKQVAALRTTTPSALRVIPRSEWHAAPARPSRLTPNSGAWNRVTVHHSAEYAGLLRNASSAESARAIRNIQNYHVGEKNYGDIAYHFLIDPSGRVFEGRSLRWQGAHAGGANNVHNIGICLLGDFDHESPSRAALFALEGLVTELRGRYGIPRDRIVGHGELRTTACPGRHLRSWLTRYRSGVRAHGSLAAR